MIQAIPISGTPDSSTFARPLIPVAIAVMAGIFLGVWAPGYFSAALVGLLIIAGAILRCIWRRRAALILPLLLCIGFGYLSIQPWLRSQLPLDHVARFADQGKWQVSGVVDGQPEASSGRVQFVVQADHLTQGERRLEAHGKIKVTAKEPIPALRRGDQVTLSGHLRDVRGMCNPGGFDYERFMAFQGVQTRLYAQDESLARLSAGLGWQARLDDIRAGLDERMSIALKNHPITSAQVLKALTLGVRDTMSDDLIQAFSRTGITHILAISGLNIGMVAAVAFAIFSWVLAWVPPLTNRAWVRKAAALFSLVPVVGYCLLAGMSPSVQRSMIMCMAFLLTYWIGRRHEWLNALAVAALVILLVFPAALMSVSFQLSFVSVLAILLGIKALPFLRPDLSQPLWRRWGMHIATSFCISILAILGTTPLVALYFNQFSWVGPFTNLVVVPLVGMVAVPAGLLGIMFVPISSFLSGLCWQAAAWGLDAMVGLIQWVAQWPWAASTVVTPSLVEMGLFYLLLATLLLGKQRRVRIIGLAVVVAAAGIDAGYWVNQRFGHKRMTVTAMDVGQGSANLLQLPGGFTALVDGGGFSDNEAFDVGRNMVAPLLWRNKIRTVDLVILTHPNSDHLNGLIFILQNFKVGRIWSNHEPEQTLGYHQWQQIITARALTHDAFDRLPRRLVHQGVTIEILGPPSDFLEQRETEPWRRDLNNNSLVVRVSWGKISFLFTGDIMAPAEEALLALHGAQGLESTVLFVPHHGSQSSSTVSFLQAVHPKASIISAGYRNRFKFPHAKVLQRLEAIGSHIQRTDQCGAVQIVTDGIDYGIQTCRKDCGP